MIEIETTTLFPELATTVIVDGVSLAAITGMVEQKHHEVSGLLVETMQLTALAMEIGSVTVGQLMDVEDVEWEVEAVQRVSTILVVVLIRNLG